MTTTESREQREVIPNLDNISIPFSDFRFGGGKDVFGAHDPQLDGKMFKWGSGYASYEDTKGDRDEAECQRNTPLATGNGGDLEGITTDKHDEDLAPDFCKKLSVLKWLRFKRGIRTDERYHDKVRVVENTLEDV